MDAQLEPTWTWLEFCDVLVETKAGFNNLGNDVIL